MFKNYSVFETLNNYYTKSDKILVSNTKRAMFEILTSICILNPNFLTEILEGGYKKRYTLDNISFMTDVKNIILNNNTKFKIGTWDHVEMIWKKDSDISKIHYVFNENSEFDVDKNWNILVKSDKLAKSIIQELNIEDSKISKVYWTGLDVFSNSSENLVIELDDKQLNISLKNIFDVNYTKSANDVLSDLFETEIDLYNEDYEDVWNILTNKWINLIYDYSKVDFQKYLLEWLDVKDIDSIDYKEFNKIRHPGKHNQKLGKHIPELNKNIIMLKDLCKDIYNNKEEFMNNPIEFSSKWNDIKDEFLNSRILEHVFINQLKRIGNDGLYYIIDGLKYKTSTGKFKNNIITLLLNKILNTDNKEIYIFSENGKQWTFIPSVSDIIKDENIQALYRYHSILGDDISDFELDIWIGSNEENIIKKMLIGKMTFEWTGEMSSKIKCKLVFDYNIKKI